MLKVEIITNRVNQLAAEIRPLLAERNSSAGQFHDDLVADFCERIAQRVTSVQRPNGDPKPGIKVRRQWNSETGWLELQSRFRSASLTRKPEADGKLALRISAEQGSSVGSWRTKVFLENGRYRLEGKVKTRDVLIDPGDRRGGAGFRVGARRQLVSGTSDWKDLNLDFVVPEAGEVELLCEVRAAKGEAWFDADSLRLMRK